MAGISKINDRNITISFETAINLIPSEIIKDDINRLSYSIKIIP